MTSKKETVQFAAVQYIDLFVTRMVPTSGNGCNRSRSMNMCKYWQFEGQVPAIHPLSTALIRQGCE